MGSSMLVGADMASTFPFLCFLPSLNPRPSPPRRCRLSPRSLSRFCSLQATTCLRRHLLAYACISTGGGFEPPAEPEAPGSSTKERSLLFSSYTGSRRQGIYTRRKGVYCSVAIQVPGDKEAIFDMKLPRRNLLVQFTCKSCGERTQRMINRLAYERGTVFVQCAGCLVNHKLVDNLGLVVEYDLRNDTENGLQ